MQKSKNKHAIMLKGGFLKTLSLTQIVPTFTNQNNEFEFCFLSRTVLTVEYPVVRTALLVNFQALGTIYIPGAHGCA